MNLPRYSLISSEGLMTFVTLVSSREGTLVAEDKVGREIFQWVSALIETVRRVQLPKKTHWPTNEDAY